MEFAQPCGPAQSVRGYAPRTGKGRPPTATPAARQRAHRKRRDPPPWLDPCLTDEHSFWSAAQMARWPSFLNPLAAELRKPRGAIARASAPPSLRKNQKLGKKR